MDGWSRCGVEGHTVVVAPCVMAVVAIYYPSILNRVYYRLSLRENIFFLALGILKVLRLTIKVVRIRGRLGFFFFLQKLLMEWLPGASLCYIICRLSGEGTPSAGLQARRPLHGLSGFLSFWSWLQKNSKIAIFSLNRLPNLISLSINLRGLSPEVLNSYSVRCQPPKVPYTLPYETIHAIKDIWADSSSDKPDFQLGLKPETLWLSADSPTNTAVALVERLSWYICINVVTQESHVVFSLWLAARESVNELIETRNHKSQVTKMTFKSRDPFRACTSIVTTKFQWLTDTDIPMCFLPILPIPLGIKTHKPSTGI